MGRNLICGSQFPMQVKAVARKIPCDVSLQQEGVTWCSADILEPAGLNELLNPGDVVINLAYISDADAAKNLNLINNVIDACINNKVARLIHCSTAVVAGVTQSARVDESTTCEPLTPYEKSKLTVEQCVLGSLSSGLDVAILRPTAIVGVGGKNLLKLANSLQAGNKIINYLRSCLFGKRPLHLVSVRDVAAALLHLAVLPGRLNGEIYIVSSDDDPENNFHRVEEILMCSLGLKPYLFPPLHLPAQVLLLLQRIKGRSDTNMYRFYDSQKLQSTNFQSVNSIGEAIREFGKSIQKTKEANL